MAPDENGAVGGSSSGEPSATARHAAREAKDAARDVRDEAAGVMSDVRDEAYRLGSSLKDRARERLEQGKDEVARTAVGVAEEAHRSAERLREHSPFLADLVERGVGEVRTIARTIETHDLESFVGSVERFARERPALFMAASVTVGLLGARLLQSSPRREVDEPGDYHPDAGYPPGASATDSTGLHEERFPAGRMIPPDSDERGTPDSDPGSPSPGIP